MVGADNNTMSGRSEQVNTTLGVSSTYACYNCCPDSIIESQPSPFSLSFDVGGQNQFGFRATVRNCYLSRTFFEFVGFDWSSSNLSVGEISNSGWATAIDGGNAWMTGYFEEVIWENNGSQCVTQSNTVPGYSEMEVLMPTATLNTNTFKVSQVIGNQNIHHFVIPKGIANDLTLVATSSNNSQQVLNNISWEGATESANNPLEAKFIISNASKNVIRVKFYDAVLLEIRVWVVWATIGSSDIPNEEIFGSIGNPPGLGIALEGGYVFAHLISPSLL
jgi:hypothetical protein